MRKFGVHRFTKPPEAQPPTLTVYVESGAVDLKKLAVPANVQVTASYNDAHREKHKADPIIKSIDRFVAQHNATRAAAGKSQKRRSNDDAK